MRFIRTILAISSLVFSVTILGDEVEPFIHEAPDPTSYVLARLETHPIVIFGEAHWIREEVGLIRDLVPRLPGTKTRTIAMEILPASRQALLDEILAADEWREDDAISILRLASMPHEEYLEVIKAVWRAHREHDNDSLQLVALGPGKDWREKLPEGTTYDSFMAKRVEDALHERGGSILVYTGLHHAFTRYMQPETTLDGRARQFMIRMGNHLWWEFGERVFVITSHRPIQCTSEGDWIHCVPFQGTIECAARVADRGPFAFDVAGSPFAELRFDRNDLYSPSYPALRLVDFVDGLVWFAPVDELHQTRIMSLSRYAPTTAALDEVSAENPFDDRAGLSRRELEDLWRIEIERQTGPIKEGRWKGVGNPRELCPATQP